MSVFPVCDSTLAPVHIASFVQNNYKINDTVTARILKTGINHTYLITAGEEKYIFRVYSLNWRTEKEIAEEIRLLGLLQQNNIPVSFAIADTSSAYIQHLQAPEGLRFGVLFSFAKGEKTLNMQAELHYKIGVIMASMHKITDHMQLERVTYTPEILLVDPFEKLKQFLPEETDEMVYMKSLQIHLQKTFHDAGTKRLRSGAVHIDIWFDNMSISNGTDITIFDFDFCGNGLLLLDIAYYVLQLYSTEKDGNEFNLKRESFFKGYESVTCLSEEEKKLIPAAGAGLYFFYLGIQCSRYDNWSNNFLNEIYLKRFINLLVKKWANFYNLLPADEFITPDKKDL
ncbi:MAG: phosphotransferase [Bacteroidota bacterium]